MKFFQQVSFSKFTAKQKIMFIIVTVVLLIVLLSRMVYLSYTTYRDTIITQQENHLLTIAKSVSRSLELFVNEKEDNLNIIANDPKFQQQLSYYYKGYSLEPYMYDLKSFYEVQQNGIEAICLLDNKGKLLFDYPNNKSKDNFIQLDHPDVSYVLSEQKPYIGNVYKNKSGNLVINILEPIFYSSKFQGMLISTLNLDIIYELMVQPVKVGEKGYVMVKDDDGIILMHPAKEQIGIDVIDTRKEMYPDFDFSELEMLIKKQLAGEEGTMIYHSYWWTDNKLVRVKKLNGFSPVHIGDSFWVVAATMSYDEIAGPIKDNLLSILSIVLVFIILISFSIFIIVRMQKNKEALEIETKYLKELNEAAEELRKSEAQLQHSQKLQTIGTLTGGIAHEFNNLLTPILGYSEIILNDLSKESDLFEEISEIYDSSKRAKDLIEQILIFSHRNNTIIKFKPVKINELVKETLKLVRLTLPSTIKIVENFEENYGYILANSTQIHQVLINLCTNAFYAMKEHGGDLEIGMKIVYKDEEENLRNDGLTHRSFVKISIKDTGCGITDETMKKIFDPFYTTKAVGEGTGLGLSVVHGIIAKHQGKVTVESKIGVGSTFNVYLPRIESEVQDENSSKDIVNRGKESILVVDDKAKIVKVMKKGLEQFGYDVSVETNSLKALKTISNAPYKFDLIITDQTMPNLEGTELAKKLKDLRPDIKIILITGFIDENVAKYINSPVIDDYLVKPILTVELHEKIRKALLSFD